MTNSYRTNRKELAKITRDPNISTSARLLLHDLLIYAGVDGRTFPSHKQLASDMGLSTRQVGNLVNELRDYGLIHWKRKGFNGPSSYKFSNELYGNQFPDDRNISSDLKGNLLRTQSGTEVPPNNVSNTAKESSNLQLLFEDFVLRKLTFKEMEQLETLISYRGVDAVSTAIKTVISRANRKVTISYLATVLQDIPAASRPFKPCRKNGCNEAGFIKQEDGVMMECECQIVFRQEKERLSNMLK